MLEEIMWPSKWKKKVIKKGRENPDNITTIPFDLQVTICVTPPHAGDCQKFHKRKLSLFSFTTFDSNEDGYCYLWDETHGKKRSIRLACVSDNIFKMCLKLWIILFRILTQMMVRIGTTTLRSVCCMPWIQLII